MPHGSSRPHPDPSPSRRSVSHLLLQGRPGSEGFRFHDGHNQPVHQAAPGLLGLLEGRHLVERWKPAIVAWMDQAGHFFNHILHEYGDEPYFAPLRFEIESIRDLDLPPEGRNRLLFQYLRVVCAAREQERASSGSPETIRVPESATDVSLNGPWSAYYRLGHGRYEEREIELPTNWELAPGMQNYAGAMRFTRTLYIPEALYGKCLLLSLRGVDYFADVWVNGHHVGGHEGFFGPFELDVSRCLHYGEINVVRLAVTSPNEPSGDGIEVASGWNDFRPASSFPNRKTLVKGTLGHHDAKRGGAWSSITSQDGNTGGVWNDIELRVRGAVRLAAGARMTTLALSPPSAGTGERTASVELRFPVENMSKAPVQARLRVHLAPANFEGTELELERAGVLQPGRNEVVVRDDHLSPVRVWQPWDHGFPHLYTVRAVLEPVGEPADEVTLETGFRTLGVTPIGESTGSAGSWVINGTRVFVRGTNLLPTYWLSEYDDQAAERDFNMLRAAGFNAVIVHTLVGPKRLYEKANRAGIMVEQIFPLQWSYDMSPDFVERARRQVRELTGLLHNEPSVVSYETHNEPDMRVAEGADNRFMDFDLHAAFRDADPHRWATTYSSGNHAYPGQFYPLRDDNSFATLPARFEESEFAGRRISRHRNMPTEFGIQAMPNPGLFEELLSEERVRDVLRRMRTDPKWRAADGESWDRAEETMAEIEDVLGGGSWRRALDALDWRLLRKLGHLHEEIRELESQRAESGDRRSEHRRAVLGRKLAALLLDVLHYGGFKGENFWFGNWKPGRTLAEFARSSQDRQYRLHKDAVETYLNAGSAGPIVGYFSFMFRDCDWQAPTWGVVDAAWLPKKAYRAYLESNQPVRVTLPQALRRPAKLCGDPWFGRDDDDRGPLDEPWSSAEVIVANDSSQPVREGTIALWVEDGDGRTIALTGRSGQHAANVQLPVDIDAGTAFSYFDRVPEARAGGAPSEWVVAEELAGGTYYLKARVSSADGRVLSTNSYELFVLDTEFAELGTFETSRIEALLWGSENPGFHYWGHGRVVYEAEPGVMGFIAGHREARQRGIDLYETAQGEHFFRHILAELEGLDPSGPLLEPIWRIRSETISPAEKTAVLFGYLERFVARVEQHLRDRGVATPLRRVGHGHPRREPSPVGSADGGKQTVTES
ncbi:MAG TPA: hypothetical protein VHG90_02805 [Acidimicrobiales bacterium]|nr:hypothetical protein [Acidimicrobiales bacterium]